MNRFKEIAQKTLSNCRLMEGRTKMEADEVNNRVMTIMEFDLCPVNVKEEEVAKHPELYPDGKKSAPVFVFAEAPDKWWMGGSAAEKLVLAWAADYDGDIEAASDELKEYGGVQAKFKKIRLKNGNAYLSIEIL